MLLHTHKNITCLFLPLALCFPATCVLVGFLQLFYLLCSLPNRTRSTKRGLQCIKGQTLWVSYLPHSSSTSPADEHRYMGVMAEHNLTHFRLYAEKRIPAGEEVKFFYGSNCAEYFQVSGGGGVSPLSQVRARALAAPALVLGWAGLA